MINEDEELALGYLLDPTFELTNTAGKPLTEGWINVYVHGTRNKYYCYSDWNGNLHPFNIPLDGLGSNIVLASPQFTYDVYVYSKYGTLQMSRYNVSPVGVGDVSVSGINDITSSDGTVEVSQYGDTFDLSVPDITAVSGLVEDVTELTSAVSGLTEDVEEINTVVSSIQEDIESLTSAVSAIQVDYVTEEELSSAISAVSAMVPAAQVQSDWDENDPSSKAYILNKPDMAEYVTEEELASAISAVSGMASVHTDNTIRGDGTELNPLGIEFPIVAGNNIATGTWNQFGTSFTDSNNGTLAGYRADGITLTDPNGTVNIDVSSVSGWNTLQDQIDAVSAMVPEAQVQSDWDEDDPSSKAYIQNKPEEKDLVAGDGIDITVSGTSVIISADIPSVSGFATEEELASVSGTLQLEIDTVSSNPRVKIVEYGVDVWSDVVSAMDGVSSGKYDYVVMKYSANGTDLYAPLVKYTPGEAAFFVCPAHGTGTTYGYGTRRTTDVYTINSGDMWFDYTVRPFQGRLIGAGNVSVTVEGEDYIVSGTGGSFEQVNADWNATSGVAEILNKPETVEIETVGVSAGSGIAITEVASGIVISCTVTGSSFEQVNSDWEAASGVAEILNKPETIEIETVGVSAGSGIAITEAASGIVISCTVTGGPDYTAGSGIDITNDVISVDNTVALKTDIPTYTAGDNIDITNDVISVTGTGELIAGDNITITASGTDFVISAQGGAGGDDIFLATYGTTTFNEIETAHNAGKTVFLYKQESFGSQGYMLPLAGVFRSNVPSAHYAYFQQPARYTGAGGSSYLTVNSVYIVDGNDSWSTNYVYPFIKPTSSDVNKVLTCVGDGIATWQPSQGGGSSYTAGSGIDITNDVISLEDPVNLIAGNNISISVSGASAVISSTGGGTSYSAGNMISLTNDTISVSTTAGITDIQQVASLPASPVATVLYLIPET